MALRQRLGSVTDILRRLEQGRFLDGLERLQESSVLVPSFICQLLQVTPFGQRSVPDTLGQDQFLKALFRVKMALWRLKPGQLCRLLDELRECLHHVREDADGACLYRTLAHVETKLQLLDPVQTLSRLQHLAQVIQQVRTAGGFQPHSYHPSLAARLHQINGLTMLQTLDEATHAILLNPTNLEQLHLLCDFLHAPQPAPAG